MAEVFTCVVPVDLLQILQQVALRDVPTQMFADGIMAPPEMEMHMRALHVQRQRIGRSAFQQLEEVQRQMAVLHAEALRQQPNAIHLQHMQQLQQLHVQQAQAQHMQPLAPKPDALLQQAAAAEPQPRSWSVALKQQQQTPLARQPGPAGEQAPAEPRSGRPIPRPPPLMTPQAAPPPAVQPPALSVDLSSQSFGSNASFVPLPQPSAPPMPSLHADAAPAAASPPAHPRATSVPADPGSQALRRSTVQQKAAAASDAGLLRPPGRLSGQRQSKRAPEQHTPPNEAASAARAPQDLPVQQSSFAPAAQLAPARVSDPGVRASAAQGQPDDDMRPATKTARQRAPRQQALAPAAAEPNRFSLLEGEEAVKGRPGSRSASASMAAETQHMGESMAAPAPHCAMATTAVQTDAHSAKEAPRAGSTDSPASAAAPSTPRQGESSDGVVTQPSDHGGASPASAAGASTLQAATSADTAASEWLSAASEHSASERSSAELDSSMHGGQAEQSCESAEAESGRESEKATADANTNGVLHSRASANGSSAPPSEASLSTADEGAAEGKAGRGRRGKEERRARRPTRSVAERAHEENALLAQAQREREKEVRRLAEEQRRHEAGLQRKLAQLRAEQERQQAQAAAARAMRPVVASPVGSPTRQASSSPARRAANGSRAGGGASGDGVGGGGSIRARHGSPPAGGKQIPLFMLKGERRVGQLGKSNGKPFNFNFDLSNGSGGDA